MAENNNEKITYTDRQKAVMLTRAGEIGIHAAAKEFGIAWQTLARIRRQENGGAAPDKQASGPKEPAKQTGAREKTGKQKTMMTTAPELIQALGVAWSLTFMTVR